MNFAGGSNDFFCCCARQKQELSPAEKKQRQDERRYLIEQLAFPKTLAYSDGNIIFESRTSIKGREADNQELFRAYDVNGDGYLSVAEMDAVTSDLCAALLNAMKTAKTTCLANTSDDERRKMDDIIDITGSLLFCCKKVS